MSHYFTDSWARLTGARSGIWHSRVHPFVPLKVAEARFMAVDRDFDCLPEFLAQHTYRLRAGIVECPQEIRSMLESQGLESREWATILIDMQRPLADVIGDIKKSALKAVRRTQRAGCRVERVKDERQLARYHSLIKKSRRELGFRTDSWRRLRKQWRMMHPQNYDVFVVMTSDDEMIAGMGVLHTKDYMIEVAAGQSSTAREHSIYSNDLLKHEIIKWAHEQHIAIYDLAGIDPRPEENSKASGIRRFKEKWGGRVVPMTFFERTNTTRPLHRLARRAERIIHPKASQG